MIRITKILILSCIIILPLEIFGLNAFSKRKPSWVKKRPVDNNYYIGIGKSNKSQVDFIQSAKQSALADLISEISVKISSNSILEQLEENNQYKEKYKAQILTQAKDDIKNYELVDSWSNKNEYWVYYRLSKKEYERIKRERLEQAKRIAKDFYEKAKDYENSYDIHNAFIFYIKSFNAIEKHIGEDLSVFTFDGRVYLDNAIYQSMQEILSKIKFAPAKEKFSIKALSSKNETVSLRLKLTTDLETQNLVNVPLVFIADGNKEFVLTKEKGIAACTLANSLKKGFDQVIRVEVDLESYFKNNGDDNLLKQVILNNGVKPYFNLSIDVNELFAYLESEELVFENQSYSKELAKIYERLLSENYFSFTNDIEKADLLIKINSAITKGTKLDKHNLHTVFLNSNITIKDLKSELIIFTEGFENLKGIRSGSFVDAKQDAIRKAEKKIEKTIIPEIRKIKL